MSVELRLIEVIVPEGDRARLVELAEDTAAIGAWHERVSEGRIMTRILSPVGATEPIMDRLESEFGGRDGFRIIVFPVAASIPHPEPEPEPEPERAADGASATAAAEADRPREPDRISRAELYTAVSQSVRITPVYLVLAMLSAIVAALGVLNDNVAIVIGAMVIAPLLGPNVALSMATTLADTRLGLRAFGANLAGVAVAFGVALLIGVVVRVDPEIPQVAIRTQPRLGDIALALAAGSAGALAFTTGVSAMLIGVMVAVALLPPLVVAGMLLGAGSPVLAAGALLLVVTNVICINLAGVATFLAQGIRPRRWWEAERARRASWLALLVWATLLAALFIAIRIGYG